MASAKSSIPDQAVQHFHRALAKRYLKKSVDYAEIQMETELVDGFGRVTITIFEEESVLIEGMQVALGLHPRPRKPLGVAEEDIPAGAMVTLDLETGRIRKA